MAKKSSIIKNIRKRALSFGKRDSRLSMKENLRKMSDFESDAEFDAFEKLQQSFHKRPRNESEVRAIRTCALCGRPKGNYRRFNLCRVHFREAAMRGDIPGLRKASW
jgi:small subunit ribosomal protein S14